MTVNFSRSGCRPEEPDVIATRQFRQLCLAALGAVVASVAPAAAEPLAAPNPVCALSRTSLDTTLPRTREALLYGRRLTIVTIGSSSTSGAGASSAAASYPSRLEALLKERFHAISVRVINRGVNGEEDADMLARFGRDVFAEKPDLVLWQVGANAVLRGRSMTNEEALIRHGIERLKTSGADVALIDLQYTPEVLSKAGAATMVDLIAAQARRQSVGLFRRFEMMKEWRESAGMSFLAFSSPDGLHMNDWGYDCFARNLAAAISEAAAAPVMASTPANSAQ
jgi:acyl-CoA thioesterase I